MENIIIEGIVIGLSYALIALGISITFKVMDVVNFAHGELYMLGGFFTYLLMRYLDLPYVPSGIIAIAFTAIMAWMIYKSVGRVIATDRMNTLLATFAISLIISNIVNVWLAGRPVPVETQFNQPIIIGSLFISGQRAVLILVGVVVLFGVWLWLQKSFLGKQIRAVSDNVEGAQIIGISTSKIYKLVFIGGGAVAGLAGVLLSPITQTSASIGLDAVIKGFVILVIGGAGNILGAAIGGILLGVAEAVTSVYISSSMKNVIGYLLLILVLLVQPAVLMATFKRMFHRTEVAGKSKKEGGMV